MTLVYLIRHGESEANSGTGVAGDSPLSARGIAQAERLRDRLAETREIAGDVLITSPLQRALRTAEILAPTLGLPLTLEPELVERRVGVAFGVHVDDVRARWPQPDYVADPGAAWAPDAETPITFQARVSRELARLLELHRGKTVVMVCHAGVISAAMLFFQGLDTVMAALGTAYPLPQHRHLVGRPWLPAYATRNTSITRWRFTSATERRPAVWYLDAYNDSAHLSGMDPSSIPIRRRTPPPAPTPTSTPPVSRM